MKTIIIKDLSVSEQLDSGAMSAVRGGMLKGFAPFAFPLVGVSENKLDFGASQSLLQSQNTEVNNGNNAAFVSGITSHVEPHQTGTNTINFR